MRLTIFIFSFYALINPITITITIIATTKQPNLTSIGLVSILFNGLQSHGHQQLLRSGKLPQQQVDEAKMAGDEHLKLKEYEDTASSDEKNNIVEFLDATITAMEASEVDELATIADDTKSSGAREKKLSTAILRTLVLVLKQRLNADDSCPMHYATYPNHPEVRDTTICLSSGCCTEKKLPSSIFVVYLISLLWSSSLPLIFRD